jgi:tetratricopeptide (TPR) repeat protein
MTNPSLRAAKDFKKAVTAAKNHKTMFWRSQAPELALMLTDALEQFKKMVKDPQIGVRALVDFYKRDAEIYERCDDSYGNVGDVFRITAARMLAHYASQCVNKDEIADQVLALQEDSNYGVRDILIDKVSCFLDKRGIERLIAILERKASSGQDIISQRPWLFMIESLACQIKDGALFERTRQRNWQGLNSRAYIDIAKVYFSSGDALTAYDRLQKAAECGTKDEYEYAELYRNVCRALGKTEEVNKISWDIFRQHRCMETLNELIAEIGEDERAETIYKEVGLIMAAKEFSVTDAQFLLVVGQTDCAQDYIIEHCDQLNGEQYYSLTPLAESLEAKGLYLAAIVIYRALLEGNLAKALSKYYSHGVRYLRRLDAIADRVSDWDGIDPHADYVQKIKQRHGRKPAFWAKYECKERPLVQN